MAWPRTRKPLLLLGVAVVAATAGCRSGGGEAPRAQPTTTVAVTSTTVGVASSSAAGGAAATTLAPGAAPLRLSARHPAGVTLKLTSIAVAEETAVHACARTTAPEPASTRWTTTVATTTSCGPPSATD